MGDTLIKYNNGKFIEIVNMRKVGHYMILDLKGVQGMEPVTGMLYSMFEGNYQRLKSIVAGMSQEELDYKGPDQKYNSTAQLLKHLAYVDLNWVFRIKGEAMPDDLKNKYGPMLDEHNQIPEVNGASLEDLLENYDTVADMLKTLCMRLTDRELDRVVEYENGNTATIRWGIWHMGDHNRYHQAHINQLRKWFRENED